MSQKLYDSVSEILYSNPTALETSNKAAQTIRDLSIDLLRNYQVEQVVSTTLHITPKNLRVTQITRKTRFIDLQEEKK